MLRCSCSRALQKLSQSLVAFMGIHGYYGLIVRCNWVFWGQS